MTFFSLLHPPALLASPYTPFTHTPQNYRPNMFIIIKYIIPDTSFTSIVSPPTPPQAPRVPSKHIRNTTNGPPTPLLTSYNPHNDPISSKKISLITHLIIPSCSSSIFNPYSIIFPPPKKSNTKLSPFPCQFPH